MRVVLIGGTGMLGTWLGHALRDRGDEVLVVTRQEPIADNELSWTSSRGIADVRRLECVDAVVNLMGAPIADRPWTRMRRNTLRDSRIASTEVILQSLARLEAPPKHYLGVGHLGFYGDQAERILTEEDGIGEGFLAELARDWEQAHERARTLLGARTAVLRMAVALSPTGGVFPLMVQPFRIGLGGWLGDGKQYLPWVDIRDALDAMIFLLDRPDLSGTFNGCVPEPTRQKDWTKALGRALNKPAVSNAPRWALRGAIGELADDLFLASIRAVPRRLQQAGFRFQHTDAEATFRWLVDAVDQPSEAIQRNRTLRPRDRRAQRS